MKHKGKFSWMGLAAIAIGGTAFFAVKSNVSPRSSEASTTSNLVPVEIILLIDTSGSVDAEEYRLQRDGYVDAFMDSEFGQLVERQGGIAVCYVEWSDADYQDKRIDWRRLSTAADCRAFAADVSRITRRREGSTRIAPALLYAARELDNNTFVGLKKVIDVSGDGVGQNHRHYVTNENTEFDPEYGIPWPEALPVVLASVRQINGICITTDDDVVDFYRDVLIQGEGSFMMQVDDFNEFGAAIREKLVREVSAIPGMYD